MSDPTLHARMAEAAVDTWHALSCREVCDISLHDNVGPAVRVALAVLAEALEELAEAATAESARMQEASYSISEFLRGRSDAYRAIARLLRGEAAP